MLGTLIVFFILWLISQALDTESGYGLYLSLLLFGLLMIMISIIMATSIQVLGFYA